ncbi:MAG: hypothetical protein KC419_16945 [Anaerolineales bacterium]|nr:hypothetical protein [Anaerolineales bacterium]MCA9930174.1 hypothetical protein [Anaerolineales bacterium]
MSAERTDSYIAYLIRLWHESPDVWRGMLADPHTGERRYFTDADELLAFLREQIEQKSSRHEAHSSTAGNQ